MKHQNKLEIRRAMWTTAANMALWYKVLCKAAVDTCKIAVRNPSFDPEKPYDVMFYVIDKDMIFEWDQTGFALSQKADGKRGEEKTMVEKGDDGTTVANTSDVKWSFTGGSFLSGDALPGIATPPSVGVDPKDAANAPCSNIINPTTGQPYEMVFKPHPSGGSVAADAPGWFRTCVAPVMPRKEGKRGLGLCDGLGANIDSPVLVEAEKVQTDISIRVPHSTQKTQGFDTVNMPFFKSQAKLKSLTF
jgi:hypothetical protein